ncbi:hypothetical protein HRbin32_01341 [bacterium HR32]|jgi:predicted TIM-barrel fold metal-dependent hydrolase|nr:hypothetical protein HRbin32_01341 [bacterium HR32]
MIHGIPLVDAHLHPTSLRAVKMDPEVYFDRFPQPEGIRDAEGRVVPERFDAFLEEEGVDVAILLCEYSPRVTGVHPVEDLLPFVRHNPRRFRFLAQLNPYYHYPVRGELERQLALGAIGLKIHPVHNAHAFSDPMLYPAYAVCEERGLPVVVHFGTSVFPGAANRFTDPAHVADVLRDFPDLTVVLAHGGRGWWYDAAAFLALRFPNVWIELSGLPPKRLPDYFGRHDLARLARKFIFGTDWPTVPGIRANALQIADLGFDREVLEGIFYRNAVQVYGLGELIPPDRGR